MADCMNVEIRELLPERAGGALSAADIARIDAHLADCALCAEELALINTARRTLRYAPSIDVGRITSRVVAATAAPSRPQLVRSSGEATIRPASRLRFIGLRAAAAIAIAAAGIGAFAVWQSTDDRAPLPNGGAVAVAPAEPAQPAELGVGGELGDLSSGDLQSLLGDLGGSSVAAGEASFDEPEVIVPEVGTVNGWESL